MANQVVTTKAVRVRVKWDEYDFYMGCNPEFYKIPVERSCLDFSNPFHISYRRPRELVVEMYENYIRDRLKREPQLMNELRKLRGKRLACWCGLDQKCHVDVVLKLIEENYS